MEKEDGDFGLNGDAEVLEELTVRLRSNQIKGLNRLGGGSQYGAVIANAMEIPRIAAVACLSIKSVCDILDRYGTRTNKLAKEAVDQRQRYEGIIKLPKSKP